MTCQHVYVNCFTLKIHILDIPISVKKKYVRLLQGSIELPVTDSLCHMLGLNILAGIQVRDRSGNFTDLIMRSRGQAEFLHCFFQKRLTVIIQMTMPLNRTMCHSGIADRIVLAESPDLDLSCLQNPLLE